jgi:hypothetical protein
VSTDALGATPRDAPVTAQDAPTTELVSGAVGDRCANCQAQLAPDQRYCVNCGDRRGRARFSPETLAAHSAPAAAEAPTPPPQHRPRFSSAATLVAGVATLLIALGVGVLIGHDSNTTSARQPASQIITVGGGSSSGAAANTTAASGATSATAVTHSSKKAKTTVVHVTQKSAKAATAAASKVLGSSGNISHNVTQSVGGSCSGGAGCQNGKFTGNFFPSG